MTARRSDSFLLEAYMRRLSKRMGCQIRDPHNSLNTPYDNPVLLQWGSNSISCDREDLAPLIDAMADAMEADSDTTPASFLRDTFIPFLREHADKADHA